MTLLVSTALLALAAAGYVVHPILFRRWGLLTDPASASMANREARKRVALAALRDAEYEHAAGKLDAGDYQMMRGRLESEALEALRAAEAEEAAAVADQHSCGFLNPSGSRFCAGCGQRLP